MYLQPVQKGVGGPDALNHCIPGDGDGDGDGDEDEEEGEEEKLREG